MGFREGLYGWVPSTVKGEGDYTLRKASLTTGLVISPLFQRFSMRSLFVAPELRQAILLNGCTGGRVNWCVIAPMLSCDGKGNAVKMRRTYLLNDATAETDSGSQTGITWGNIRLGSTRTFEASVLRILREAGCKIW
jgi:hypothetical protein